MVLAKLFGTKSDREVKKLRPSIDRINQLDMCIVWSVPSKSHPEDCINNFVKMMDEIKVRKSLVQVDHKIH